MDKLQPGCKIKVYGQYTRVSQIKGNRVYFRTSVVVPDKRYTIDYCNISEIEEIDTFEFYGIDDL